MEGSGEQPHLTTGQAARFATLAYTYGSGQGDEASKRAEVEQELQGTGWRMMYNRSNRQLSTLYNEKEDHLHIAHKGTQPNSTMGMMDLASDVKLAFGKESSSYQFNYRKNETERIYNLVKPKIFTMSGHSLGGATLIYALENSALLTDAIDQADTFNAGASPFPRIKADLRYLNPFRWKSLNRRNNRRKRKLQKVVTHHRMEKDFVSISMRVRAPAGEIRMYPLKEAVGPDRKDELKKMNIAAKGLEAHHLDHFDDDGKAHMSNYKSSNIKGSGPKPAPPFAPARRMDRAPLSRTVRADRGDIARRIRSSRSIQHVVGPYIQSAGKDRIPTYLMRDLAPLFRAAKREQDREAVDDFTEVLNQYLQAVDPEDIVQEQSEGDIPAPPAN